MGLPNVGVPTRLQACGEGIEGQGISRQRA